MSRDPLGNWGDPGQRGNAQNYAGNNPVNYLDPLGLDGINPNPKYGPVMIPPTEGPGPRETKVDPHQRWRDSYSEEQLNWGKNLLKGTFEELAEEITGRLDAAGDLIGSLGSGDLAGAALPAMGMLPGVPGKVGRKANKLDRKLKKKVKKKTKKKKKKKKKKDKGDEWHTFYHGSDGESLLDLLNNGLNADKAKEKKIDGPLGFFLATELCDAEFFGGRRGSYGVVVVRISGRALEALKAKGAKIRPIKRTAKSPNFEGKELYIPVCGFPEFGTQLGKGRVIIMPLPQ